MNHILNPSIIHLSLRQVLVGLGEAAHVLLDQTVASQELDVGTILLELALLAELDVLLAADGGETPLLGDDDLLAAGELVHRATEGLDGGGAVGVTGADGQDDLADVHTGDGTLGLTEGTTHTSLQTIGTSARQHLVDTDDVEGVHTDAQVETFLTGDLDEVPIAFVRKGSNIWQSGRSRTCWRKYGQPREPQRTAARTRWRPGERSWGSRQRRPSCDQDRRYES